MIPLITKKMTMKMTLCVLAVLSSTNLPHTLVAAAETAVETVKGHHDGSLLYKLEHSIQNSKIDNSIKNDTKGKQPIMVCGTRTDEDGGNKGRQKRYAVSRFGDGSVNKWDTTRLTWAITDPSRQMPLHKQRRIIRESLQAWSDVSPLVFVMVDSNSNPDISIRFAKGRHGPDFDPVFDGRASATRANIFGHAWGPGMDRKGVAGDVHIDDDDDWSEEHKLKGVTVHELGHSMGLSHSDDPEAIMFAVYRDTSVLSQDDIRGIQFLYGANRGGTKRITMRPMVFPTPRPRTRRPPVTRANRGGARRITMRPRVFPTPRPRTRRPPVTRTNRGGARRITMRPRVFPTPRPRTRRPPVTRANRGGARRITMRPRVFPTPRPRTRRPPVTRSNRGGNRRITSRPRVIPTPPPRTQRPPYVTRKPHVTVTEPAVPPTLSPDSICLASDINAVVEDPFSVVPGLYYVFQGDTVHHIMSDGTRIDTMALEWSFPGVPRDPDVVFSVSEKKRLYFIKDHQSWEMTPDGLTEDSPKSIRHINFPEKPTYAISLFDVEGKRRLYLFGKQYWWSYFVDSPRPSQHYEIRKFSRDLPADVNFATNWADDQLYIVSRDSYIILDTSRRAMTHQKPLLGKPNWMMPLCSGVPSLTSHSLLTIAVISLVSFIIRR